MATKAILNGKECDVRVETDIDQNWSVSILSGEMDPVSLIPRPAAPVVMKLRAKTRWTALDQALRSLKEQGRISDFTLDPRPAEELAALEAEKAKAAAKKAPAGAKAAPAEAEDA
jgi:hypothetical protein